MTENKAKADIPTLGIEPKQTIAALITGRGESDKHLWPVLGRYLCEYPMLAAKNSRLCDCAFISTDGKVMQEIARKHGIGIIDRPPEYARADSPHVDCLNHALKEMADYGLLPDILVVLLANVAIHQWGLIDRCIKTLQMDPEASAVVPVVKRPRYSPHLILKGGEECGGNDSYVSIRASQFSDQKEFPYFLTHQLWALRVEKCFGRTGGQPPWTFMGGKVLPFEVDCGKDVDSLEELKMAERWLIAAGWTPEVSMYETEYRDWADYEPRCRG